MPEDFSDSRRRFLGYAIGGVAGAVALGYAVPIANYIVRPSLTRPEAGWSEVGRLDEVPIESPTSLNFLENLKVGWQEKKVEHDVWVVRHADGSVTAFSPTCPHLGCGYRWNGASARFECPCHASTFDVTGKVMGGPAPRDLDTLPAKVEGGVLFVRFMKFRLGIPDKAEA